jgi:undecaprenyl-diphosphatase
MSVSFSAALGRIGASPAPRSVARFVVARDFQVMTRVNQWRPPRWIRLWAVCATRGGDGWLWYALGIFALLFGGPHARWTVLAAALACASGIGVFLALKRTFRRKRPCAIAASCWATLLPPDQFSFPSGHTITAFSIAVPFAFAFPALAPVLLACALSVAISRVLLGMHFLSDVVAGGVIGSLLGYAALAFVM